MEFSFVSMSFARELLLGFRSGKYVSRHHHPRRSGNPAPADTTRRARATRRGSSAGASILEGRDARGRASRDEHRVSETLGRDGTRAQIGSDTVREGMRRPRGGAAVRSLPDGGRRAVHRVHQRTDVVGVPRQVRPPRAPSRASRAGRTRATFRLGIKTLAPRARHLVPPR